MRPARTLNPFAGASLISNVVFLLKQIHAFEFFRMIPVFSFSAVMLLSSCGGSLSDEQRKKFREKMDSEQIVRVTDIEIMAAALDQGRVIHKILEDVQFQPAKIDSIENARKVNIRLLIPGKSNALALEQELIDAYINALTTGDMQENIQKVWIDDSKQDYDSILYTKPKLVKRDDGVEELEGIWNIYLSRKDVVLNFGKKK